MARPRRVVPGIPVSISRAAIAVAGPVTAVSIAIPVPVPVPVPGVNVEVRVVAPAERQPATPGPGSAPARRPIPRVAIGVGVEEYACGRIRNVGVTVGRFAVDPIAKDVVIEAPRAGDPLKHVGKVGFRVCGTAVNFKTRVVPAVGEGHLVKAPGIFGDGGVNETGAIAGGEKGGLARDIADFIAAAGAHRGVLPRIEWEKHADPAFGVQVKYQEVPVGVGVDLEADFVAGSVSAVVVHPQPNRRTVVGGSTEVREISGHV
jgi:hypothetical protein